MKASKCVGAVLCALLVGLTFGAGNVLADNIDAGFDLLTTVIVGQIPFVEIPNLGVVPLKGCSFNPGDNIDTIVHRLQGIAPFDLFDEQTIQIELVTLCLKSAQPVELPGGILADLFVTVNRRIPPNFPFGFAGLPLTSPARPRSLGTMTIRHSVPTGGSFDSFFDVFADLTFTIPGGSPTTPADVLLRLDADKVTQQSIGQQWSHIRPPNYPTDKERLLPAGNLFACVIFGVRDTCHHNGPHPDVDSASTVDDP